MFSETLLRKDSALSATHVVFPGGRIEVTFVMAKTCVAPLRRLSIPRLELQAPLLAVTLAGIIKKELTLRTSKTGVTQKLYFYTL